jgi:hypothetical protein
MAIEEIVAGLPSAEIEGRPLAECTHAELLSAAGKLALWRLYEYVRDPSCDSSKNVRDATLVAGVAANVAKLLAGVQIARLRLEEGSRPAVLLERASRKFKEEMDEVYSEVRRERAARKREAKARKAATLQAK